MNIFLNQNDQRVGPYSSEQLRNRIYSGEIQRTTMACVENTTEWVPLETLLRALDHPASPPVIAPPPNLPSLTLEQLRDPEEKTALGWLFVASIPGWLLLAVWTVLSAGMALLIVLLFIGIRMLGSAWFAAYIKTNAIRVSEKQLPEIFRVVQTCSQRLGMAPPDVYILQQNVWNAFATKIFGRPMVVLLSGAVDAILLKGDVQQLSWLIGHELAHHRAGHLDFVRKLANAGDWCVWLKLWYSRRAELTCDRIGLYCAGRLRISQLALMNLTVGSQLAGQVNTEEALRQWAQHRDEFFVKYRTLYSTHPHHLARLEFLNRAAAQFGIAN